MVRHRSFQWCSSHGYESSCCQYLSHCSFRSRIYKFDGCCLVRMLKWCTLIYQFKASIRLGICLSLYIRKMILLDTIRLSRLCYVSSAAKEHRYIRRYWLVTDHFNGARVTAMSRLAARICPFISCLMSNVVFALSIAMFDGCCSINNVTESAILIWTHMYDCVVAN